MKKILVSIILMFTSAVMAQAINTLDPTQVYNTGNIVNNTTSPTNTTGTWQNIGLWNQGLPCWAPGGPVYCGPQPYFNQGSLNFSYGYTDVHQIANIANALPNSGTGLRVNGFNFGFMAKNGNGWDDGRVDYLTAYVKFYNSAGNVVTDRNYNLTYKFDWTNFNYSETFTTPYASKDLSTVRYGFAGYDTNGWAGPYGPEIYNISFSLKYSVDPCFNNVLYSPSCPGYLDALAKLTPPPPAPITTATVDTSLTNTIIQPSPPPAQPVSSSSPTNSTTLAGSTMSPATTTASVATSTTNTSTASLSTSAGNKESVNNSGLSIGLSVVAKNQQREQNIAMQAAQSAVAAADQAGQQAQQDAVNIAQTSSANSIINSNNPAARTTNIQAQKQEQTTIQSASISTQLQLFQSPTNSQSNTRTIQSSSNTSTTNAMEMNLNQSVNFNSSASSATEMQSLYSLLPPQQTQLTQQPSSIVSQSSSYVLGSQLLTLPVESNSSDSNKFFTDRTNPLYQALENNTVTQQNNNTVQQGSTVNKNAQNNELAGGVDITRIAQAPTGYNEYLNLTLRDAAFYAPKEVYRNQRVIDNTRVLRQLSSDRLHNEMVEQQYRR